MQSNFSLPLSLKSLDEAGQFAGYASVFGVVDGQNDIVVRGAFEKTIAGRKSNIKLLWQHKMGEPIGTITRLFEDTHGLFVQGQLLLNVARAREAYTLLKSGAVSGLSIGYTPVKYTVDPLTQVRRISEVDLWEISLVTFPANEAAQVTVVKSKEQISGDVCQKEWLQARQTGGLIMFSDAISSARHALSDF